jgi:WD40 repeat protein
MLDSKTRGKLPDGITLRQTLKPPVPSPITRIAWTRDGSRLAIPSRLGVVHIWDAQSREFQPDIDSTGATWATAAAWSAKGDLIAIARGDKRVRIWDTIRGHRIRVRKGKRVRLEGTTIAWSDDGRFLAFGQAAGGLTIWDVDRWEKVFDNRGTGEPSYLVLNCVNTFMC